MKLTKTYLKQLIKEEFMKEYEDLDYEDPDKEPHTAEAGDLIYVRKAEYGEDTNIEFYDNTPDNKKLVLAKLEGSSGRGRVTAEIVAQIIAVRKIETDEED